VFFGGAVLAGAFGGIFGFALSRMAGLGGLNGWQWIVSHRHYAIIGHMNTVLIVVHHGRYSHDDHRNSFILDDARLARSS
jgi:hypothetical protein